MLWLYIDRERVARFVVRNLPFLRLFVNVKRFLCVERDEIHVAGCGVAL